MTDATILIPTFRHAALVPYSLRSALTQEGAVVEVFVVGDGVEEDTRVALAPFLSDPRVRFFDFPKGERNGELSRHEALHEASGRIVCYLSDDDLLLRDLYMWQQLLRLPDFRGRTARRLTHLHFPDSLRRDLTVTERVAELERWWRKIQQPGFADELAKEVADVVREAAVMREARIHELHGLIRDIQATRSWRLRTRL